MMRWWCWWLIATIDSIDFLRVHSEVRDETAFFLRLPFFMMNVSRKFDRAVCKKSSTWHLLLTQGTTSIHKQYSHTVQQPQFFWPSISFPAHLAPLIAPITSLQSIIIRVLILFVRSSLLIVCIFSNKKLLPLLLPLELQTKSHTLVVLVIPITVSTQVSLTNYRGTLTKQYQQQSKEWPPFPRQRQAVL
jgi:hypothetical protein